MVLSVLKHWALLVLKLCLPSVLEQWALLAVGAVGAVAGGAVGAFGFLGAFALLGGVGVRSVGAAGMGAVGTVGVGSVSAVGVGAMCVPSVLKLLLFGISALEFGIFALELLVWRSVGVVLELSGFDGFAVAVCLEQLIWPESELLVSIV